MQKTFKRIRPGLYKSDCGRYEIERGDAETNWHGLWIAKDLEDKLVFSDPLPTLTRAISVAEYMESSSNISCKV